MMVPAAAEVASTFRDIAWLIPLVPFGAFLIIVFAGRRLPGRGAPVGIAAVSATLVLGLGSFFEAVRAPEEVIERSVNWVVIGPLSIELGMRVDALAAMMFVVVGVVSLLVQIYSVGYMQGEPRYTWYFATLNLFTGAMLTLVIANNLVLMLVGWEGVGICSYLLIGHFFESKENSNAANKAFITTRAGDLGFVIGIFVIGIAAGTFNIGDIREQVGAGAIPGAVMTAGAVLLFLGAMGKSAQFPLHVWLPDAMAGPTPVSALIHAATMVTAGVYMVGRIYDLFLGSEATMTFITIIATITMLMAAVLAVVARDIKKVLAYSTVSQLALMMAALAIGGYTAGMFHLWTHAFFKALLFLGAGSVIHAVHSNDMFEMGGLRRYMPVTFWTFIIGSAALAGLPPLAGFWSKDEIIATAGYVGNYWVMGAMILTAFLTAFYMTRACVLTFFGRYRKLPVIAGGATDDHDDAHSHGHGSRQPHESPALMAVPLLILAALSIAGGWIGTPVENFFAHWIDHPGAAHPPFNLTIAAVSVAVALAGIGLGWLLYSKATFGFGVVDPLEARLGFLYRAAVRRFYIDDFYMKVIVRPVQYGVSKFVYVVLDQKLFDRVVNAAAVGTVLAGRGTRKLDESGVDGAVNLAGVATDRLAGGLRRLQVGNVQLYATALFVGLVVLVAILFR